MARIVISCWGSHGDIDPSLGLALGLRARGHAVAIATLEHYRDLVTRNGLGFHPIRPLVDPTDVDVVRRIMNQTRGSDYLLRKVIYPGVASMYDDLVPVLGDVDLAVSHPLSMAVPIIAEQFNVPWASTVLAPISFFSRHDTPVFPPAPWLKSLDRFALWPGRALASLARATTAPWAREVHALRHRLGLSRGQNPLFDGQHSPHLVLALYSRVLGAPQPDWPPNVVVTGHMFHDGPHGTTLTPDVEAFLAAGPPPLLFTLGSSAVLVPGDFWKESIAAVQRLGQRAILLVGPGRAEALRPQLPSSILAMDGAPHSLLMPRAAAVVQQCGIGTMAQSLRSGRPMLAVPFAHDQPDNAYRAGRLGMSRTVFPKQYRAARVADELGRLLDDPAYTVAAARTAAVVRSERGIEAACDALESRFSLKA
ncbi:MAG: glycosyltransferase family 1 protein [Cytophagaceae bacterium]|nr:glycosyltransferase family 1 protein [Gemmatimonadaceae bacterium]